MFKCRSLSCEEYTLWCWSFIRFTGVFPGFLLIKSGGQCNLPADRLTEILAEAILNSKRKKSHFLKFSHGYRQGRPTVKPSPRIFPLPAVKHTLLIWLSHISPLITQKCLKSRSNMAGSCHLMMSAHTNCKGDSAGFHSYSTDLVSLLSLLPFFSWTLNLRPLFFR